MPAWLSLVAPGPSPAQTQFIPLGYLDGYGPTSEANALTPDGSKAVGYSTTSLTQNQACWWSALGIAAVPGMQDWYANSANAVSADGAVVVGERSFGGTEEAWYYTPANQIQPVPFPAPQSSSTAKSVSGDGQIIVGVAVSTGVPQSKAFRWDRSQAAAVFLPQFTASTVQNSVGADVSDDGRRVIGTVQIGLSTYAAALWDDGRSPVLLSRAGDVVQAVAANALSPDGNIIVGAGYDNAAGKGIAFRWTAATGAIGLANPTDGYYAIQGATAINISGDGRVIVGYGNNAAGQDEAIVWYDGQPYRVSTIALAAAVLPPSWETFRAYGLDYFGNKLCGYGRATSGKLEAYVLVLDATPAPPPLNPPVLRSTYTAGQGLTIRYPTVPGLKYRVHGGTDARTLAPINSWSAGLGAEQQFVATPAITGGAASYFLRVEVANN